MSWAYNAAGRKIWLPERPLEPPDCWREDPEKHGKNNTTEERMR